MFATILTRFVLGILLLYAIWDWHLMQVHGGVFANRWALIDQLLFWGIAFLMVRWVFRKVKHLVKR